MALVDSLRISSDVNSATCVSIARWSKGALLRLAAIAGVRAVCPKSSVISILADYGDSIGTSLGLSTGLLTHYSVRTCATDSNAIITSAEDSLVSSVLFRCLATHADGLGESASLRSRAFVSDVTTSARQLAGRGRRLAGRILVGKERRGLSKLHVLQKAKPQKPIFSLRLKHNLGYLMARNSKSLMLEENKGVPLYSPFRAIDAELELIEAKLQTLLDSRERFISEICHYLIDGSGKRMRPAFSMLVYRACGGNDASLGDAIDAAISIELIHSATLLHDDIVDGGTLRRGKPSAYARFGVGPTLIAGDYLFSRAFELFCRFDEHLVRMAAEACIELTEGEVMEGRFRRNASVGFADYLNVITGKTASLFRSGGRIAADLAKASAMVGSAMGDLGLAMGLAFQMIDDLLDVIGPEEKIGKPVGSDLRTGTPSLPIVLGVQIDSELREILQDGNAVTGAAFDRALQLLRSPRILKSVRAKAAEQMAAAQRAIGHLAPSVYSESLTALIAEQTERHL